MFGHMLNNATEVYKVSVRNVAVREDTLSFELYGEEKMVARPRGRRQMGEDDDDDIVHLRGEGSEADSESDVEIVEVAPLAESDPGSQHSDALSLAVSSESGAADANDLDLRSNLEEAGSSHSANY